MNRKKRSKLHKSLGQTALEYFVTYSWALALVLIIGALLYINGFPGVEYNSVEHASLDGMTVLDFKIDTNGDLILHIGNTLERNMLLTGTAQINGVEKAIIPVEDSAFQLSRGESGVYIIQNAVGQGSAGEEVKIMQIAINYVTIDNGLQHTVHGFAIGKRQAATEQAIAFQTDFNWESETEFAQGQYNTAKWDSNGVTLTSNKGDYISDVRDAGTAIDWSNLTWTQDLPFSDGTPVAPGVAARWSFDNTSCNALDQTSNNNVATLQPSCNQSVFTPGVFGNAACFNGINQKMNASTSASLNPSDITIEIWVYDDSSPNWYHLVEKGYSNQYRLGLTGSGKVRWLVGGVGEMFSKKSVKKKKWTHIVATYKNNPSSQPDTMKIYVDGVLDSTFTGYGTRLVTNEPLTIGATKYDDRFFKGCLDEIRIYNSELNSTAVNKSYVTGDATVKFQARSCDDANCVGETFVGPDGTNVTFYTSGVQALNLTKNRYIQFKTHLATSNLKKAPKVFKVTIKGKKS